MSNQAGDYFKICGLLRKPELYNILSDCHLDLKKGVLTNRFLLMHSSHIGTLLDSICLRNSIFFLDARK